MSFNHVVLQYKAFLRSISQKCILLLGIRCTLKKIFAHALNKLLSSLLLGIRLIYRTRRHEIHKFNLKEVSRKDGPLGLELHHTLNFSSQNI